MNSLDALIEEHCTDMEYVEYTSQSSGRLLTVLKPDEPGSEPFDSLYRRHMERCIDKKRFLTRLRTKYIDTPDIVQQIGYELRSVERFMDLNNLRSEPASKKLSENIHAWIHLLPWLNRELVFLDAQKVDYKPKRTKERKLALKNSIAAIKHDYASQTDVQKLLRLAGPRPHAGQGRAKYIKNRSFRTSC
ncbi:MAG: hypothetical protein ACR2PX_19545 [Endozoicomonas sp.]|uniref:hypothetical protein n=1 Tax=Endozoicomonas sp. TaxID=1892382 RepID=UPI003D9B9072